MRFIAERRFTCAVLVALISLLFVHSDVSVADEPDPCAIGATSCERPAQSRFFQMTLWVDEQLPGSLIPSRTDTDVPMFSEGWTQPAGRSIMSFKSWDQDNVAQYLALVKDWSRIVAVVIDEPYWTRDSWPDTDGDGERDGNEPALPANPCSSPLDGRKARVEETTRLIKQAAAALKAIAPKTRLWVNFSEYEMDWMMDEQCALSLNGDYIDVVSLDIYNVSFASIRSYYDWLVSSWPQQQLALVPGTFFTLNTNDPSNEGDPNASRDLLQGFFSYANEMNQRCDRSFGSVGLTGNYDGCKVWMVAGWFSGGDLVEGSNRYIGVLDPRAAPILSAWRQQLAYPRRFGPRNLSRAEVQLFEALLSEGT